MASHVVKATPRAKKANLSYVDLSDSEDYETTALLPRTLPLAVCERSPRSQYMLTILLTQRREPQ